MIFTTSNPARPLAQLLYCLCQSSNPLPHRSLLLLLRFRFRQDLYFFFFLQGKDNPRISSKYNEKDVTTKRSRVIFSIRAKFFQIVEYFRYSIRFDDRNNRWNGQFSLISGRGDGRSKRWEKLDGILRFHRGNEYA